MKQTPLIELRLAGLYDAPDPGAVSRMAAFDELPRSFRQELGECPFDFNAPKTLTAIRERGSLDTLRLIRASVARERRVWAMERADALSWARQVFRNGH